MKKYIELYNDIKSKILSKEINAGDKLYSVRKCAAMYNVSITTVQNAYFELCADGYLIAVEKSGYYVADIKIESIDEKNENISETKYNLMGIADEESFDFSLWQRYIKSSLRQTQKLATYSEARGEAELREAIAGYIKENRNIITSSEKIIIGAGIGVLYNIIASLLKQRKSVSFPDKSFTQGMGIFKDYGYSVYTREKDADIIYVSPSHMTRWGDVMPIKRRLELVQYSKEHGSIVIEDDFENEFLYNKMPTPSLFTLGKGNIIYIGSFSAMLLPGIRISFMVLNDELYEKFKEKEEIFAQTASKTEQLALASYIRDGHLNYRIKKIRRLYTSKTKRFSELLKESFPNADIAISENSLQIIMKTKLYNDKPDFKQNGVEVFVKEIDEGYITLIISPSGIKQSEIEDCINALKKSIN